MTSPLLGAPVAAVLGLCAGVAGTVAHPVLLRVVGVEVPVGLMLALALSGVVHAGVVAAFASRAAAVAGVVGWGIAAYCGLATGPGGDFLLARPLDLVGAGWLVGGPLVLALATVVVRRVVLAPSQATT